MICIEISTAHILTAVFTVRNVKSKLVQPQAVFYTMRYPPCSELIKNLWRSIYGCTFAALITCQAKTGWHRVGWYVPQCRLITQRV